MKSKNPRLAFQAPPPSGGASTFSTHQGVAPTMQLIDDGVWARCLFGQAADLILTMHLNGGALGTESMALLLTAAGIAGGFAYHFAVERQTLRVVRGRLG